MDRREFFRRTGSATVAVALVATPLSLFAEKPRVWKDENGRVIVDGHNVILEGCHIEHGVELRARGAVTFHNARIEASPGETAIHVAAIA